MSDQVEQNVQDHTLQERGSSVSFRMNADGHDCGFFVWTVPTREQLSVRKASIGETLRKFQLVKAGEFPGGNPNLISSTI
jgi:hypothetical protein